MPVCDVIIVSTISWMFHADAAVVIIIQRTLMKSSIVILILRNKQYYCVVPVLIRIQTVCIFARFKVNCEVMTLLSFANFKIVMSRHRKEWRGAPKAWGPMPAWPVWPVRKYVTDGCDCLSCWYWVVTARILAGHQHYLEQFGLDDAVGPDKNFKSRIPLDGRTRWTPAKKHSFSPRCAVTFVEEAEENS